MKLLAECGEQAVNQTADVFSKRVEWCRSGKAQQMADPAIQPVHLINNGIEMLGRGGSMRNVNERFSKLLARAAVPATNRPVHRIRKTASTSLRREGVHTDLIDRIFGWSPTSVRQRYYSGADDEELHEAILRLYRARGSAHFVLDAHDQRVAVRLG